MKGAKAFVSPESLQVTLDLPHKGKFKGMGVKQGITLIVGGGYHGKSTLLNALELGVYDHIAGVAESMSLQMIRRSNCVLKMEDSSKM